MRYMVIGNLSAAVLTFVLAASTDAFAQRWRGITEAENRIVFLGHQLEDYQAVHQFHPFDESKFSHEHYRGSWKTSWRSLPVLWTDLYIARPGLYFFASRQRSLEEYAKGLGWFKNRTFVTVDNGTAGTVMGLADYLIFTADKHRCGLFVLYFDDGAASDPDILGNTRLTGLYCPVSAQLDVATLESLLSKVGVRGIAVPKVEEPKVASLPPSRHPSPESLATLVTTGDIKGLRRVAAKDFDPDTVIPFRHPRFAGGRLVRRPILVAAALFGRTEIVVFLLNKGASTDGRSAQAICPAAAIGHLKIVEVLLRKNPKLKDVERCGRSGNLTPTDLARRRGHREILNKLLETNSR